MSRHAANNCFARIKRALKNSRTSCVHKLDLLTLQRSIVWQNAQSYMAPKKSKTIGPAKKVQKHKYPTGEDPDAAAASTSASKKSEA